MKATNNNQFVELNVFPEDTKTQPILLLQSWSFSRYNSGRGFHETPSDYGAQ